MQLFSGKGNALVVRSSRHFLTALRVHITSPNDFRYLKGLTKAKEPKLTICNSHSASHHHQGRALYLIIQRPIINYS